MPSIYEAHADEHNDAIVSDMIRVIKNALRDHPGVCPRNFLIGYLVAGYEMKAAAHGKEDAFFSMMGVCARALIKAAELEMEKESRQ